MIYNTTNIVPRRASHILLVLESHFAKAPYFWVNMWDPVHGKLLGRPIITFLEQSHCITILGSYNTHNIYMFFLHTHTHIIYIYIYKLYKQIIIFSYAWRWEGTVPKTGCENSPTLDPRIHKLLAGWGYPPPKDGWVARILKMEDLGLGWPQLVQYIVSGWLNQLRLSG